MRCRFVSVFLSLCGIAGAVEPSVVRSREKVDAPTPSFHVPDTIGERYIPTQ